MQQRHTNPRSYYDELAQTSQKYYIPYLSKYTSLTKDDGTTGKSVLEIGCGEGGNLKPFAQMGCKVTGVDVVKMRTDEARQYFADDGLEGNFINQNIFDDSCPIAEQFDIVLCHDVIEHIPFKADFLARVRSLLRPDGVAFFGFPAWQMPFGGHQQICNSRVASHLPWIHLLPTGLYRRLLHALGVKQKDIDELMSIKKCRMTIENFERLVKKQRLSVVARQMWLINPHYDVKFGLKPRKLAAPLTHIRGLRDVLSTSVFYVLRREEATSAKK